MRENGTDPSQCGSIAAAAELARGGWTSEDREAVASDLLNVLHRSVQVDFVSWGISPSLTFLLCSIPITSIATNGPSLVHKVRFVASTLLDSVRKAETAPASAARAHAYLCTSSTNTLPLKLLLINATCYRGLLVDSLRD